MLYTLYADGLKLTVTLLDDKDLSMLTLQDPENGDTITIPMQSRTYLKLLRKAITDTLNKKYALNSKEEV